MPHANDQYYNNIIKLFSYPITNLNEFNFIFFANKCPFFPIIQQHYRNEAFEFMKSYQYLKQLALNIKQILPDYIPLLKANDNYNKICLTRKQVALLFLLSFFGCFPENTNSNLNSFYVSKVLYAQNGPQFEFGRCFLNYLTIIGGWLAENNIILDEKITYVRQCISRESNDFENMNYINLCEVNIVPQGSLFNSDSNYFVDFSNKYIGGGSLNGGCVQEEILFATQPELLIAMVFMEVMDENDGIGIYNTIQYSAYNGYGKDFTFLCSNIKGTNNIKKYRIIAIDAGFKDKFLNNSNMQIYQDIIKRDIYKAFAGFSLINYDNELNNMNNNMNYNSFNNMNNNMNNMNMNNMNNNMNNMNMNNNMNNMNNNMNNMNMNNMNNMNNNMNNMNMNDNMMNNMNNNMMNNMNNMNNNMNNMNNNMNSNINQIIDRTIATGNWGCGIYNGIHQLKFIEQWIAASFAGVRRLDYYTFGHKEMENVLQYYHFFKNNKFVNASYLYRVLIQNKLDVNNLLINLANGQF